MLKNKLIAFDLDGTLVDSFHRHQGCLEYWFANNTRDNVFKDKLLPLCQIHELLKDDFSTMLVTARTLRDFDIEFLDEHDLHFDYVLHRNFSEEEDDKLKRRLLTDFFLQNKVLIPTYAFDDKSENLIVFREFGFVSIQPDRINLLD